MSENNANNTLRVKISVDGIPALTEAINRLATALGAVEPVTTEPVQTAVAPAPVPVAPTAPVSSVPVQTPVASQPVPTAVPTSAVVNQYTRDQLAVAASGLINMGKQQRLLEILHGFGVQALTELPENMYGAFAGAIKMEGAVI